MKGKLKLQGDITSHLLEWLSFKINKQQFLIRMWRKGNPYALLVGLYIIRTTMENNMNAPKKLKNWTTLLLSNFTSGYLSKEILNSNLKRQMNPYIYCSITHNSQDREAT